MATEAMTAYDAATNAAVCCEMARDAEDAGDLWEALGCYAEAEAWLMLADMTRPGWDGVPPSLDARAELERRMGMG